MEHQFYSSTFDTSSAIIGVSYAYFMPDMLLAEALSQIDTLVTVSEDDLLSIYELATGRNQ